MDISNEDRPQISGPPKSQTGKIISIIIGVLLIATFAWWMISNKNQEAEIALLSTEQVVTAENVTEETTPATKPIIELPVREVVIQSEINPEASQALLPTLDSSDVFVRNLLLTLNNAPLVKQWLESDNLVRRGTILIDGLTRGSMQRKFLPIQPPTGKFQSTKEGNRYWINPSNYLRYNALIHVITSTDPQQLANTIHYLRPLLETAFGEQGYDNKDFGSTLLLAINELLSTPIYEQPPELKLESVYFKYQDTVIEKMSDTQKQLIRTGPENTRKVQAYLQQLYAALIRQE